MKPVSSLTREELAKIASVVFEALFVVAADDFYGDDLPDGVDPDGVVFSIDGDWNGALVCDQLSSILQEVGLIPDDEDNGQPYRRTK